MIEQINIALEQKGSGNFSIWVIEARRRLTSERRHIHQLKVMKNEHHAYSSEQDDIVNSLNYEGIAVIELQFYHFPDSDRLRVGSVTDSWFRWLAKVMVISQPPGNNPSRVSCFTNAASVNCSECFQRHLAVLYITITTSGNSLEMVLLSIFYTNRIHGGIISRLFLYSNFVAPCACSSSSG